MKKIQNYKLFQLLRTLSKSELDQFESHISSYLVTLPKNAKILIPIIISTWPAFNNPILYPGELLKVIPNTPGAKPQYVIDLLGKITRELEHFLLIQQTLNSPDKKQLGLAEIYLNRDLYKHFNSHLKKHKQYLDTAAETNWIEADKLHQVRKLQYGHPLTIKFNKPKDLKRIAQQNMFQLDRFFLISKLIFASDLRSRESTEDENHSVQFLEQIIDHAEILAQSDSIIELHLHVYRLYEYEIISENNYCDVCNLFFQIYSKLSFHEAEYIYAKLINHANRMIIQGAYVFEDHIFEVSKFVVDKGLFKKHSTISHATFLNICSLGSVTRNFDWTEKFIQNYKGRLPIAEREAVVRVGRAYRFLHLGESEEAIAQVGNLYTADFIFQRRVYGIYLRAIYESYQNDKYNLKALLSRVNTTRKYISKSQKSTKQAKRSYINLVRAIKRMTNYQERKKTTGIGNFKDLEDLVKQLNPITSKRWLENKLIEIKSRE